MRGIKLFVFGIFIFIVINSNFLFCLQEEEWGKDDYGKIIGQIVDAETGEPVKEKFFIGCYPNSSVSFLLSLPEFSTYSDENGFFSFSEKVKTGLYILHCYPNSKDSGYSIDPDPINFKETFQEIKVERGKITQVFKKVYLAGKMKIIIVNSDGSKINPKDYFSYINIGVDIHRVLPNGDVNKSILLTSGSYLGNLDEGEYTQTHLFPGIYNIEVDFNGMGYGNKRVENIVIDKNMTTDVGVVLDMNDQTGVFGKVVDQNGNPISDLEVSVSELDQSKKFKIYADVDTDSNGIYKIFGLEEGIYEIIFFRINPNFFSKNKINIKNNFMIEINKKF